MTASINQHHVHRDDEPLPGAKGGQPAVDYSPETIDHTKLPISEEGNTQDFTSHTKAHHNERANQEPVGAGFGGGESRTLGDEHMSGNTPKPGLGDKVVGKTQEVCTLPSAQPSTQYLTFPRIIVDRQNFEERALERKGRAAPARREGLTTVRRRRIHRVPNPTT